MLSHSAGSESLRPQGPWPTSLLCPWASSGKKAGVGCQLLKPKCWRYRDGLFSRSVVSDSLRPHGLKPTRLLCPWDSPDKNTGVGCHALLQGIFPTQGSNPHLLWLLCWQVDSLLLSHGGSQLVSIQFIFFSCLHH